MHSFLAFLESLGPWGPGLAALIDGLGLPNPNGPDIMLVWFCTRQPDQAWLAASLMVIASLAGNFLFFWLARKGGEKYLDKKLTGPRGTKVRQWYRRYGIVTVFIPTLIPLPILPMKALVLCAGAFGVGPLAFLGTVIAGRVPRYFGLAYLGHEMGEHSAGWLKDHTWHFAGFAAALFVFCYFLLKFAGRRTAS